MSRSGLVLVGREAHRQRTRRRTGRAVRATVVYGLLLLIAVMNSFPLFWLITGSSKIGLELVRVTFLPEALTLFNYERVWSTSFPIYLWNSVKLSVITTFFAVLIGAFGAYSLSRFRYRGKNLVGRLVLLAYMFPSILLVVPLFVLFHGFSLVNTHEGLIIAYVAWALPFAMWLLTAYFNTIPSEIEEAAKVDGCGNAGVFFRIMLPLSLPALATIAIFAFIHAWNEFLLSLVLINSDALKTLGVGMFSQMGAGSGMTGEVYDWGVRMAASTVVIVPALLFFGLFSRHIMGGLTAGAVKG
jgi:ABC-type glycerol-3-phosphate transport system permease component